jgi:hypothetical protein
MNDGEQIAAGPARIRCNHSEHGIGGDRPVDGCTTLFHDPKSGFRR